MKRASWGAVLVLILGLLTALTPYFIFPVCETAVPTASGGTVPMKCFWTARAALGSGGMIAFSGFLLLFFKSPGIRLGVALMLLPTGLLTILTPTKLIGVCPDEMMACHMGTLPALSLLGLLTFVAAAGIALSAKKYMAAADSGSSRKTRKNFTLAGKRDRGAY